MDGRKAKNGDTEKLKGHFSEMLHDLKTPLATISGYIQLVISKANHNKSSRKWLDEALNEIDKMTKMINKMSEEAEKNRS